MIDAQKWFHINHLPFGSNHTAAAELKINRSVDSNG